MSNFGKRHFAISIQWIMNILFCYLSSSATIKPGLEGHTDILSNFSTIWNSTITLSTINIHNAFVTILVEWSWYSLKTLQNGSCLYAPVDGALQYVLGIIVKYM